MKPVEDSVSRIIDSKELLLLPLVIWLIRIIG